jgi:hypothetical protein
MVYPRHNMISKALRREGCIMPNIVDVNYDRSEMMLQVANGKNIVSQQISSDQIQSIQFGYGIVKSWFSKKSLPKVEIHVKGKVEPFILQSGKTKLDFDQAQNIIKLFAQKNEISIIE